MMTLCFASSPPIHSFLGGSARCSKEALQGAAVPLRPCLSSSGPVGGAVSHGSTTASPPSSSSTTTTTRAAVWSSSSSPSSSQKKKKKKHEQQQQKKKRVVWSDSRGLSLTSVHLFREFTHFHLPHLEGAVAALRLADQQDPELLQQQQRAGPGPGPGPVLVPAFPQPSSDYLAFRNRLAAQQVCLESCAVRGAALRGTVKVRNLAFQKTVFVRATADAWTTSQDTLCSFQNNVYGCSQTDCFSFCLDLSTACQQVEFCVCYEAGEQTFWDNNGGNNYRLLSRGEPDPTNKSSAPVEIGREGGASESRAEMSFDPFGSPRTSAGIFPEWQSWGRIENSTPYW